MNDEKQKEKKRVEEFIAKKAKEMPLPKGEMPDVDNIQKIKKQTKKSGDE